MSGSSGSGGGGEVEREVSCSNISFTSDVSSVQKGALDGLEAGSMLSVSVEAGRVLVRTDTGALLGSINWTWTNRLVQCIAEGYEYVAKVRSIDDGLIKVHVYVEKAQ